jgi:hypothetical protein
MGILRQRHVVAGNLGKIQSNQKESPSGLRVSKEANPARIARFAASRFYLQCKQCGFSGWD